MDGQAKPFALLCRCHADQLRSSSSSCPCLHPQDSQDPNPLIRALAVRTMGCIRVDKITEYLCDPLQRCLKVGAMQPLQARVTALVD